MISDFAHSAGQNRILTAGVISVVGAMKLVMYSTVGAYIYRQDKSEKWFGSLDLFFGMLLCLVALWFFVEPLSRLFNSAP